MSDKNELSGYFWSHVCMKKILIFIFILMLFAAYLYVSSSYTGTPEKMVLLNAGEFEHIEFKRIKANRYTYRNQQLHIEVDSSASFLMQSFDEVRQVTQVNFGWRSEGQLKIRDRQHEEQRTGDDAVFKLGLLLEAKESIFNPLLPSWMKRVEKKLKYPSENMIFLVVGAKHAAAEQWVNSYNKRVAMISVGSLKDDHGWQQASYRFNTPLNVVAIWLMSDGDNTGSQFITDVKNIRIE